MKNELFFPNEWLNGCQKNEKNKKNNLQFNGTSKHLNRERKRERETTIGIWSSIFS